MEKVNTLVVGGGQAGIATSEHLGNLGIDHLVLERARIAEHWRTRRWDSLVANGPAWHDRFPNMEFQSGPEAFPGKEEVADYLVAYAGQIDAPIREGVAVEGVARIPGQAGFRVKTSHGVIEARNIVAATGSFQKPVIPPVAPKRDDLYQIHSTDYHNPAQLPDGAVLVVGAGSSGTQIAEELMQSGRQVYLSVGPHDRPPRRYRGRDFVWWLGVLGLWDLATPGPGTEHVTIAVSGAAGGRTVDFRRLAHEGMTLVGMTREFDGDQVHFMPDLVENIAGGDANYLALLDAADDYVALMGIDLPEDPAARDIPADPDCLTNPLAELDIRQSGLGSIIWATGFAFDYSWLGVDTFDERGRPQHSRGVSKVPGVYFVGLPWQSRRGSSFIWGVWHDAKHVADQIAIQNAYVAYRPSAD